MTQNPKQLQLLEKLENSQTTAQELSTLIKSARDIMRKDKGLSGELDRIPMLTWIMFLKFLDDMEHIRESEAELAGKDFYPLIEQPYRWRDWAADEGGITGEDLINFINLEEANLPDGTKGQGLFTICVTFDLQMGRAEKMSSQLFSEELLIEYNLVTYSEM